MHRRLLYLILALFAVVPCYETTPDDETESTTDKTTSTETTTDKTTSTETTTDKTTSTETTTDQETSSEITTTEISTTLLENNDLHVYFINDLHYHILPLDTNRQPCLSGSCSGGLAKLKKILPEGSILINAGHSLDGELFNAFGFSAFTEAAKVLKFNAQVPSEDLYHFGLEAANNYISSQESNMVCANVGTKKAPIEIPFDKCKVSIIGFVEKERIDSLNLTGLTADDEKKAVEDEVSKVDGNIIIVVGSSSKEKAIEIAKIEKVNLVLVSNAEKGTEGTIWEKIGEGNDKYVGSLVVNDEELDSIFRVGHITFTLNDQCKVETIKKIETLSYSTGEEDAGAKTAMEPYLYRLDEEFTTDAAVNCTGAVCQTSECAAGSLVADAIVLYLAKVRDPKMPKLALVPGRIFSNLVIKDKVKGIELYKMLDNSYLSSVKVKGSALKQIFEWSVAKYKDSVTPMENYLQISEFFHVVYDLSKDEGNRVEQLQVYSSNTEEWEFENVSDDKDYNVTITVDLWEKTKNLDLFKDPKVLDSTMLDALHYYLSIYGNHLLVPPLGQRIHFRQKWPDPGHECPSNTGEVILLTLLVVGLLTGLGIFLWKYIYPRYRVRRGSTIHLIS